MTQSNTLYSSQCITYGVHQATFKLYVNYAPEPIWQSTIGNVPKDFWSPGILNYLIEESK